MSHRRVKDAAADANEVALADEGVERANAGSLVLHLLSRVGVRDVIRAEILSLLGEVEILDPAEEDDLGVGAFY